MRPKLGLVTKHNASNGKQVAYLPSARRPDIHITGGTRSYSSYIWCPHAATIVTRYHQITCLLNYQFTADHPAGASPYLCATWPVSECCNARTGMPPHIHESMAIFESFYMRCMPQILTRYLRQHHPQNWSRRYSQQTQSRNIKQGSGKREEGPVQFTLCGRQPQRHHRFHRL